MKTQIITLGFILSTFLLSCTDKRTLCGASDPMPPTVTFCLVDKQSGKSLIGSDRLYHPDTIDFLNNTPPFFAFHSADTTVQYDFGRSNNGEALIFKLNRTEMDSIKVIFEIETGECHTVKSPREFYYNNELITREKGIYVIKR
jgi:hypothetical protein